MASKAFGMMNYSMDGQGLSTAVMAQDLIKGGYEKEDVYSAAKVLLNAQGYSGADAFTLLLDAANNNSVKKDAAIIINEVLQRNTQPIVA